MARKKRRKSGAAPQAIRRAAIRIADTEGMVRSVSKSRWEVASGSSPGSWHMVAITDGGIACDCSYSTNRGGAPCKHSVAIEIILLREAETIQSGETTVLEEPGVCCTKCGSTNHRKDGIRTRKRREDGQRYRCLNEQCGARFTDGPGFTGRHLPPKAILMALMLFAMGVSPEGIALVLDQQMTLKVHRASVQRWADRYVWLVERYAGLLRPSTGGVWSCDEKFARVKGVDHWVFTVMDAASRFILSWDVSPRKLTYDAVSLFGRARDRAGCIPRIFKTDGLHPFRPAFRRLLEAPGPATIPLPGEPHPQQAVHQQRPAAVQRDAGRVSGGGPGPAKDRLGAGPHQPAALQFHSATPRAGRDHAR